MFNLAILASGEGITGEALFDRASLVIVSNPQAGILQRLKDYNAKSEKKLAWQVLSRGGFRDRQEFGMALFKVLRTHKINFISQNGWTVFTPENIITTFRNKIINSHPGPLDPGHLDFGGKGMNDLVVHAAVIYFKKNVIRDFKTEISLHKVTSEFDKGDLVGFREVEIMDDDTPETLQTRVKEVEIELLKDFWTEVEKSGEIKVIQREKRVILPGEEAILEEAKRVGIEKYPV